MRLFYNFLINLQIMRISTLKIPLKDLLCEKGVNYTSFFESIDRFNQLAKLHTLFMRSFILYCLQNDLDPVHINISILRAGMSVMATNGVGTTSEVDPTIISWFKKFFDLYKNAVNSPHLNFIRLSNIVTDHCSSIFIELTNNILYQFDKQIWAFIKTSFPKLQSVKAKIHYAKLDKLKKALYDNTSLDDEKFDCWIATYRSKLLPQGFSSDNFRIDAQRSNFKYIKCMHYINSFLQEKAVKSYQIFPIRTQTYNNYISLNTSCLIDLFYHDNPDIFIDTVRSYQSKTSDLKVKELLWSKLFNMKTVDGKDKFVYPGYSFNHELATDGFAVSLGFIHNDDIEKKAQRTAAATTGRKKTTDIKKSDPKKASELVKKKEADAVMAKENLRKQQTEFVKKKKEEFKNLSKEKQLEIKLEMNKKKEFPYIEGLVNDLDVRKHLLSEFNKDKIVVVDPGKRSIFYMMGPNHTPRKEYKHNNFGISKNEDEDYKILNYTSRTRRMFLKTKHYDTLRKQWERKDPQYETIRTFKEGLSSQNSKSCVLDDFFGYIRMRIQYMNILSSSKDHLFPAKLKWYSFLNKKHHENDLMNHIRNEFGKGVTIIIGDWSGKGTVNFMPTPNLSLKRKIAKRFPVYSIDEYLTSKLHNVHEMECKNLKSQTEYEVLKKQNDTKKRVATTYKKERGKWIEKNKAKLTDNKKVHAVLTFKIVINDKTSTSDGKVLGGCINRDHNSVKNMYKIVHSLVTTGKRPEKYRREYTKKTDQKKIRTSRTPVVKTGL